MSVGDSCLSLRILARGAVLRPFHTASPRPAVYRENVPLSTMYNQFSSHLRLYRCDRKFERVPSRGTGDKADANAVVSNGEVQENEGVVTVEEARSRRGSVL